MSAIAYTVTAVFPNETIRDEYIAWLEDGHIDAVVKGGAHSAMIVKLEREAGERGPQVEVRYIFPTRELFDRYVREFAPTLRSDGLARFGPARGVSMSRRIGEVL